ncbi:MAG: acyltransferase family protein [Acutalibacteraceae bacterium]
MKKARIEWIDRFKAVGFFFVILGHFEINAVLKSWIYSFHMPLFFFASGFTMNFEKIVQTDFKDYFVSKFKRMIIPYFWLEMISLTLYFIRRFLFGKPLNDLVKQLIGIFVVNTEVYDGTPSAALYFVVLLFFAQICLWLFIKISKNKPPVLLALICAFLVFSLATLEKPFIMHLNVVPVAVFLLYIGNVAADFYKTYLKERIERTNTLFLFALSAVFLLGGLAVWLINGRVSLHYNMYGKSFLLFVLSALLTNIGLAAVCMRLPSSGFLSFVGQNTLFYMGLHTVIKNYMINILRLFFDRNSTVLFCFMAVILYLILYPLAKITDRYFPFVIGKESTENNRQASLCQTSAFAFAFAAPACAAFSKLMSVCFPVLFTYNYFKVIAFLCFLAVHFAACLAVCSFLRKYIPIVFLIEKQLPQKRKDQKNEK